jgi:Polysaccharide deacetylase
MLKYLKHIHKTKGLLLAVHRLFDIYKRFAFGRRRFVKMMEEFKKVFVGNNVQGTFFVTGVFLDRHMSLIKKLKEQGHCLAVHGHVHVRMDSYSLEAQENLVRKAADDFTRHELTPDGFRPPYFNFNDDTLKALESKGYKWTSNRYLLNSLPDAETGSAERLKELYHISKLSDVLSLPCFFGTLVDIPVTGPDDELMIDRYRISDPEAMLKIWLDTWQVCHENNELYHLMFHPERFLLLSGQVERLLAEIKKQDEDVWFTDLSCLESWWRERAAVEIELSREGDLHIAQFRNIPEKGTVLLCNPEGSIQQDESGLIRNSLILKPAVENEKGIGFIAGKQDMIYAVGLSESSPDSLEEFLKREGFLTIRDAAPEVCSLYLEYKGSFAEVDERSMLEQVRACKNPLIRLWRWPGPYESAVTFSADICAIDFWDFVARSWHFHSSGKS